MYMYIALVNVIAIVNAIVIVNVVVTVVDITILPNTPPTLEQNDYAFVTPRAAMRQQRSPDHVTRAHVQGVQHVNGDNAAPTLPPKPREGLESRTSECWLMD